MQPGRDLRSSNTTHYKIDLDFRITLKGLYDYEGSIEPSFGRLLRPHLLHRYEFTSFLCNVPTLHRRQYFFNYFFINWDPNRVLTYLPRLWLEVANIVVPPWNSSQPPDLLTEDEQHEKQLKQNIEITYFTVKDREIKEKLKKLRNHEGEILHNHIPPILDDYLREGFNLSIFLSTIEDKSKRKHIYQCFSDSSEYVISKAFVIANEVSPPASPFLSVNDLREKITSRYYFKMIIPNEFLEFKAVTKGKCGKQNKISNISRLMLAFHNPVEFFQTNLTQDNCYLPKEIWLIIFSMLIHDQYGNLYPNIKMNTSDIIQIFDRFESLRFIPVINDELTHKQR